MRQVGVGDSVNVQNYARWPKWVPGTVIQETGPLSPRIELGDGTVVRKHHDQVVVHPVEGPWPAVTLPCKRPVSVDSRLSFQTQTCLKVPVENCPRIQRLQFQGLPPLYKDTQ